MKETVVAIVSVYRPTICGVSVESYSSAKQLKSASESEAPYWMHTATALVSDISRLK
jgi:hypothetical protein